jgi:hypothetical protein
MLRAWDVLQPDKARKDTFRHQWTDSFLPNVSLLDKLLP